MRNTDGMSSEGTILPGGTDRASRRADLRSVIVMSVPMVITMFSRMAMDVSDFVMMTFLGDNAQAAILPAQMLVWTFLVFGMGTVIIVSTFVSQSLGRGRHADCGAYAWQAVYLALGFAAIGLALRPLVLPLVRWIGHDPAIQELEVQYIRVAILTIAPTLTVAALSNFFNGVHRPRVTMWATIEGIAVNAVASFVLIFGIAGLPRLGIAGAAWGTLIGSLYQVLRLMRRLCGPAYHQEFQTRDTWRPDRRKMLNILRTGSPQGIQFISDVIVWAVFVNVLIGTYFGKAHLIATNVVWQYMRISFLPCVGVGIALTSLVGRALGEGNPARAIRLTRIGVTGIVGFMGTWALIFFFGRRGLISLFNDTPAVVTIGSHVLICAAVFQVFDAMCLGYNAALRGAGDTFWPSAVFVVTHWLVIIGGGWLMVRTVPQWGSVGPWIAATALIVLLGLLLWGRWHSRKWLKINIFYRDSAPSTASPAAEAESAAV